MEKIIFTNPDSKKNFELPLDSNMIFIYGGNGSGKTTLSRSFQTDSYMVFNTDFVNKNVYIVKSTGADVDGIKKSNTLCNHYKWGCYNKNGFCGKMYLVLDGYYNN